MSHKKKFLLIGFALGLACIALYGAGTTINGARTILNGLILGTDNSASGTLQIANGSANAHTIFSSGATTTNTIAGFTAVPTTGHIVTCTVSGTTCTLTDGGAPSSGGLVLLEQHAASNSATLDFTTFISSTYDDYQCRGTSIVLDTSTADFGMRVGTGAGPSWDSGSNYEWAGWGSNQAGGTAAFGSAGTTSLTLVASETSTATKPTSFRIDISDPQNASTNKAFLFQAAGFSSSSNWGQNSGGLLYLSNTALTGVRFLPTSGNIVSGTIRCYGIAK